jgi:hypothetical protein
MPTIHDQEAALTLEADRLAALRADPRTPAVVRRALLAPPVTQISGIQLQPLTPHGWLTLEAIDSPALTGNWQPLCNDPARLLQTLRETLAILAQRPIDETEILALRPDQLPDLLRAIGTVITRAHATLMPMRYPRPHGIPDTTTDDTFPWLPRLLVRLSAGLHQPISHLLHQPLDQLHLFAAALASIEGATPTGQDYREREV